MSIDAEIEVTAINNATSGGMTVGYYGAEVAREYAEKAKDSARAVSYTHLTLPTNSLV